MPVTVLQRLLHVLAIHFANNDSNLLSILEFCNSDTQFEVMTNNQQPTLKNNDILNVLQPDACI